ncbi:hypothetical protein ABK040_016731 [Willaertia magna]
MNRLLLERLMKTPTIPSTPSTNNNKVEEQQDGKVNGSSDLTNNNLTKNNMENNAKEMKSDDSIGETNKQRSHHPIRQYPPSMTDLLKKKKEEQEEEDTPIYLPAKEREQLKRNPQQSTTLTNNITINKTEDKNVTLPYSIDPIELMQKEEIDDIKSSYLPKKTVKRRFQRTNEKTKITFDWNEKDDTSKDLNPIFHEKQESRLLFGRGKRAGIDFKEQVKQGQFTKKIKHEDERNWREKPIEEMTERDWKIFREDFDISIKGTQKVAPPLRNWEETTILPMEVINALTDLKYYEPRPIQCQCIPITMQGYDLIGLAETGSGKTAAYIIPMCCRIAQLPPLDEKRIKDGPYGLVLVPTRELALQIEEEARKFARQFDFRVQAIIGGVSIEKQQRLFQQGCEILVATPGRLIDCINNSIVVLNQCQFIVLDEADKMIEMNFEKEVNQILDSIPPQVPRQTLMFSATMPPEVEKLSAKYLKKKITVSVGEVGRAVERIEQKVMWIKNDYQRKEKLLEILEFADPPIIVFCNYRKDVDNLAKTLSNAGYRVTTIHGSKSQEARNSSLEAFKSGKYDIMIATDVLGRGIDIKGVTLVVNYELPKIISTYTHRIGRTGRAGREGLAISFLTNRDTEIMYDLKKMLESTRNPIPEELVHHPAAQTKPEKKKKEDTEKDDVEPQEEQE